MKNNILDKISNKEKKETISVTIDKEVLSAVKKRIEKKKIPLSRLVNVLLMDFLVNYEDVPKTKKSNVKLKE